MANLVARTLRKNMTPQEVKLWVQLKEFNRNGHHFRRQVPILSFIVDFAEKTSRLAIEVDGSQHGEDAHLAKDIRRDTALNNLGYRVLRFWNFEVDTNMAGIVDTIIIELNRKTQ
jgi:very-short-patch-repair endonuclease